MPTPPSSNPSPSAALRILQVLPALQSGGVERGAVEFADFLHRAGHESLVMSSGGRLVATLEAQGSRHITFPVQHKSLWSLRHVPALRRQLLQLRPDIVHVRSRLPAWLMYFALRKIPAVARPALVSTFHGLYSVNRYSAIMGCGERVIAISHCVRDYILTNYPHIAPEKITVIHRGVDTRTFHPHHTVTAPWREQFFRDFPHAHSKVLLTMAGRLSRWKGQAQFIQLMHALRQRGLAVHGLIVGEITPGKANYRTELERQVTALGLQSDVSFLGYRNDMQNIYALSAITYNLSQHPEPFGRTVIESLALGTPVIAYDIGGPAESLRDCLPAGLVPPENLPALIATTAQFLQQKPSFTLPSAFTLDVQADKTLSLYRELLASRLNANTAPARARSMVS